MVERGLQEFHDSKGQLPGCADDTIGYSAVMVAEFLEAMDNLSEEVIYKDLLVGPDVRTLAVRPWF